jgi:phage protein D/phage baseplate assembly protein gpV
LYNGSRPAEEFFNDLLEVEVDLRLMMPGMFTFTLTDPDLVWVDKAELDIGKTVKISFSTDGFQSGEKLIEGEITSIEPNFFTGGMTTLTVRGFDKSHRLLKNQQTRSFLKMKDSDILKKVAGESSLGVDITATTVKHESVIQINQTNMEFMRERAKRIGFYFVVEDGKILFRSYEKPIGSGPTVKLSETLTAFQPRVHFSGRNSEFSASGWNIKTKKNISGKEKSKQIDSPGYLNSPPGNIGNKMGAQGAIQVIDVPFVEEGEAKVLAKAAGLRDDYNSVMAQGTCRDQPNIRPGYNLTVAGVGNRFSGKYRVTSVRHHYSNGTMETHFSVTGSTMDTLAAAIGTDTRDQQAVGRVLGLLPALVTNNVDPEGMGRVKVKYVTLGELESDWVRVAAPDAGPKYGIQFIPEVGGEVLVAFEHGDINAPIILGSVWNGKDKPPLQENQAVKSGKVIQRILQTRSGHKIEFDETNNKGLIRITDNQGQMVTLNANDKSITIKSLGDFLSTSDGKFDINSKGKILIKSTGDIALECNNFTVNAKMKSELKANSGIDITNNVAKIGLSGPTVNINNGALEVT